MELNLGADAPPAVKPNMAALMAAMQRKPQQPQQPQQPEETKMTEENQMPTLGLDTIEVPAAAEDTALPEEAGIAAEQPTVAAVALPPLPPLPRGSGSVDYRNGGVYEAAVESDCESSEEELLLGVSTIEVEVPHTESVPSLDADGNHKVSKAGKPMFKKVQFDGMRYVKLVTDDVDQLTDDSATAVLQHIIHTADSHLAAQGVPMPSKGKITGDWLKNHFGETSISAIIKQLLTPWVLPGTKGKVSQITSEALRCNLPVEGINPAEFIAKAHSHLSAVFTSQYKGIHGKDAPANAVKQAGDVLLKLLAAYERHDTAMEKYREYESELVAAEEAGTELPKAKRKPVWKTPSLKVTLPAILDMNRRIEAACQVLRARISALRAGQMPKNRDAEWVAAYLEKMPGVLSALVYTKCILDGVYESMKAAEEKRAAKDVDNAAKSVEVTAASMVEDLDF